MSSSSERLNRRLIQCSEQPFGAQCQRLLQQILAVARKAVLEVLEKRSMILIRSAAGATLIVHSVN